MMDLVLRHQVISMIGMGKNVGKTTVLNYIIRHMPSCECIGLTSIGYDGEEVDTITQREKPRIWIPKGTIFATSEEGLKRSKIDYQILETTDMMTPLGFVFILIAKSDGYILLTGPSKKSQTRLILDRFKTYNVTRCLIDGAFGKMMQSDAFLSDATILSTGLSYHHNVDDLVRDTLYRAMLYDRSRLYLSDNESHTTLHIPSVIGREKDSISQLIGIDILMIDGALTDKFIHELLHSLSYIHSLKIVLNNPTMCFVSPIVYEKASKRNISLWFKETTTLIAITINPTSPMGLKMDSQALMKRFNQLTAIPVFDILKEK